MSEFTNVTVARKANLYFDGRVSSRSILFADGSRKTLGVMLPGEYEFSADDPERMEIQSGELEVQLPGAGWKPVRSGEHFDVPGQSKFSMKVRLPTDYCCSFLPPPR